jgi:hypothetical protein
MPKNNYPIKPQVFRENGTCVDLTYNMKHNSCGARSCGAAEGEPWRQREKNDRQVTTTFEGWLQLRRNSIPCDASIFDGLHLPLSSMSKEDRQRLQHVGGHRRRGPPDRRR